MRLLEVNKLIIDPTMQLLSGMDSVESRTMLLAIGLQESRFIHRKQIGGPARGFWQFELGGGVKGVLNHPVSRRLAHQVCSILSVEPNKTVVYATLAMNDVLACAFARLLLYTDPFALPELGDAQAAWDYYERNWRPGQPHPQTWQALYDQALESATTYKRDS